MQIGSNLASADETVRLMVDEEARCAGKRYIPPPVMLSTDWRALANCCCSVLMPPALKPSAWPAGQPVDTPHQHSSGAAALCSGSTKSAITATAAGSTSGQSAPSPSAPNSNRAETARRSCVAPVPSSTVGSGGSVRCG